MVRPLKPPSAPPTRELRRVSKLAKIIASDPTNVEALQSLQDLALRATRRADRASRAAAQELARAARARRLEAKAQALAEREAKEQSKLDALAKIEADALALAEAKASAKAALRAPMLAKRAARLAKRAAIDARREARQQRAALKAQKMVDAAARQEAAYQWSLRKAAIADYKLHRVPYLKEVKRLLAEEPWTLVERQLDIVEIAGRRVVQLRRDARAALVVSGPDDPETIAEYQRLSRECKSALNTRQHETRRLKKYERIAKEFDAGRLIDASPEDLSDILLTEK